MEWKEFMYEACQKAYIDADLDVRKDVDSFITCAEDYYEGFGIFDEFVPDQIGATLRPCCTVCGDGIQGLANAYMQIMTGLMDVVSIPKVDGNYRVVPTAKGMALVEIQKDEATKKVCRIMNKTIIKGGKLQLNLHDGKNILTDGKYDTGDSIVIELPSLKIQNHLKFDKGKHAIIVKGRNSGNAGKIMSITESNAKERAKVVIKTDKEKIEVVKDYVFVVGDDKPLITVGE